MLQLKTDLQHREDALKQPQARARERPDNGTGGGRKSQGGIHSRQQERGEEWADLEETARYPELYPASGAPQIKNPKREEPLEKNMHRREEQDEQRRTTPMTVRRREESRTSSRARNKSRTPLPQSAGGGRQKVATDNFDPHNEEGTQEEKATQRTPPIASLELARKGQEAKTLFGRGVQHRGGMVVVSDRAKKATLARLVGMDAMVMVMPQEHLAKIVRRNTHRGNRRGTPHDVVARARQQGYIPRGTQRARKLPQGEGSPGSQPR